MSDKSLLQGEARSALGEGAARLDQFVQQVKTQQVAQNRGSSSEVSPVLSPDEEWSKNYMSQGIGPRMEIPRITGFAPPPMPRISFEVAPPLGMEPTAAPTLDAPSPMRDRLGKERARRSWVARLFSRGA